MPQAVSPVEGTPCSQIITQEELFSEVSLPQNTKANETMKEESSLYLELAADLGNVTYRSWFYKCAKNCKIYRIVVVGITVV